MSTRVWKIFIVAACVLIASCGKQAPEAGLSGRQALNNPHPRILLTPGVQQRLRSDIRGSHKWLWERYLQDLPDKLEAGRLETLPKNLNRGHANLAPDLSFAWLMTGDRSHLEVAKNHLLNLALSQEWDPENDLVHGHLLQGIALAYDWLYQSLTEEERSLVAERLAREAQNEYERMTAGRVWYHNQYFQNHGISNFCGFAYAAAALYGEDDRAEEWLKLSEDFFDVVFSTLPADGTSLEGLSYGQYDFEFIAKYAELAGNLLGRDFYDTPGLKEMSAWILHSLLPTHTAEEWAMTFGDAPRHANWHGPEHQLFLIASKLNDTTAQWLGKYLINLQERGLASASFWAILWYDPSVQEADPAQFPTFKHFKENDQVMMRSSWTDPDAMLVGFKCGPFMGRTHSLTAEWDWGTNHQHPDAGSFQIFANGQFLAIDPLYTTFKRTANHNTMLFKGRGQLGEDIIWMGVAECLQYRHYPEIVHTSSSPEYDYVVGDVTRAYHPALGLKKFERHLLFIKPDVLLVADRIELNEKGVLFSYFSEELKVAGGLTHASNGYVVGKQGEAYTIFEGKPGTYTITANYLDNFPGEGTYSLEVDGQTVHSWKSTSEVTDNYLILSPPVQLKTDSRISFRGADLPHNFRLIKMTVYSEEVVNPREAQWLLHFDPQTEIACKSSVVTASLGQASLDLYPLLPAGTGLSLGEWEIINPHERFRQTKRLVISPSFSNGSTAVLALLHARGKDSPGLENLRSEINPDGLTRLGWSFAGKRISVDWDPVKREVLLK